jgi:short-subunit dehydrogenase
VHTEFQEVAKRPSAQPDTGPEFVFVPVEQVVRDALTTLEADRPLVIPGLPIKLAMFLVRITPMPILRLLARLSPRRGSV